MDSHSTAHSDTQQKCRKMKVMTLLFFHLGEAGFPKISEREALNDDS